MITDKEQRRECQLTKTKALPPFFSTALSRASTPHHDTYHRR